MAVVEVQPQGVIAHGLDPVDADVLLAGLEHALARTVALDLGRRREHAQILERQIELAAVVEAHGKDARARAEPDVGGAGTRGGHARRAL